MTDSNRLIKSDEKCFQSLFVPLLLIPNTWSIILSFGADELSSVLEAENRATIFNDILFSILLLSRKQWSVIFEWHDVHHQTAGFWNSVVKSRGKSIHTLQSFQFNYSQLIFDLADDYVSRAILNFKTIRAMLMSIRIMLFTRTGKSFEVNLEAI